MTHEELVIRAGRWLKNSLNCGVVLMESHAFGEKPDAIGWKGHKSWLIECKVSRIDFTRDNKKPWRKYPEIGMGNIRYFLTLPKLVLANELPPQWGLLYAYPTMIREIKSPILFSNTDINIVAERKLLYYNLRRLT